MTTVASPSAPNASAIYKVEQSFQLKGSLFTLSVLQLRHHDLAALAAQLSEKIKLAPKFFNHAPIVIDLHDPNLLVDQIDFKELKKVLTQNQLIPVGVRSGKQEAQAKAEAAGFAIMPDTHQVMKKSAETKTEATAGDLEQAEKDQPQTVHGSRLITQPIRSGQQIYAQDGDLVIVSSVSPGAELLADGNIHVYGTLRGRALAGINGNTRARIFCNRLEAELVSIAGQYKIFEDIQEHNDEHAKQLYLRDGQLIISSL